MRRRPGITPLQPPPASPDGGCRDALEPGNPCVLGLTHPQRDVQTTLRRAARRCSRQPRRAGGAANAASTQRPPVEAGGGRVAGRKSGVVPPILGRLTVRGWARSNILTHRSRCLSEQFLGPGPELRFEPLPIEPPHDGMKGGGTGRLPGKVQGPREAHPIMPPPLGKRRITPVATPHGIAGECENGAQRVALAALLSEIRTLCHNLDQRSGM